MYAMGFPRVYRQDQGAINQLGTIARPYGTKPFLLVDAFIKQSMGPELVSICTDEGLTPTLFTFRGECSPENIASVAAGIKETHSDIVIGIGGGKALDTAKGAIVETGLPLIIVPTIASNDAPTSRLIITYTQEGDFIGPRFLTVNPDVILVDTEIIANAPVRYFISGIGDALVTKFESEQCHRSGAPNFFGTRQTEASLCIANHCYEVIRRHAIGATEAVAQKKVTHDVDKVIEANILLSGLGFEGCGVAAAHAIGMAFSIIPEMKGALHGEEVAIGLLAQFVLEGRDAAFIEDMLTFYHKLGLPLMLEDLGLSCVSEKIIHDIAVFATREGSRIHNMEMQVSADHVKQAIYTANETARAYHAQ